MESKYGTARKMLSGGVSLLASQGLSMALFFLAQRMILSELTKEQNGVLLSERRIVDLLLIALVDFGMNSVVMRRAIAQPERAQQIYSSAAGVRLLLWTVSLVVVVTYAATTGISLLSVSLWSVYLLLTARTGLLRYNFELRSRSNMAFGVPTIASAMDAIFFVVAIWLLQGNLSPERIIMAYTASTVPGFLYVFLSDRGMSIRPRWMEWTEMKVIVRESLPVFVAIGLLNLHDKIDAVLLSWLSTETQVGIYGAAYVSLAPLTGAIPLAASMVMVPTVARYAASEWDLCQTYAVTGLRFLTVTAAVISSVLSALAPIIIAIISNNRYADNTLEYYVFLWMPLPIFLLVYIQEVHIALGHQRRNLPIAVALALGSAVLGAILIPVFDGYGLAAMGAISARMIATIVAALIAVVLLRTVFGKGLDLFTVAAICAVAIGSAASTTFLVDHLSPWSAAVAAGSVSIGLSFLCRLLRWSDLQMIAHVVRLRA